MAEEINDVPETNDDLELNDEKFGDVASSILGMFGITKEHMNLVKSVLNSVKKTDYKDRTVYEVDLKGIKITVAK